jgi:hypothetical protein
MNATSDEANGYIRRDRPQAATCASRARRICVLSLSSLFILACPQQQAETDPDSNAPAALAWVNGSVIREQDLQLASRRGPQSKTPALLMEAAILARVTLLEARRRGLEQRPEIAQRIESTRTEALRREFEVLREALKRDMMQEVEITEDELREAYEEDDRSYNEPQMKYREWTFPSEAAAQAAVEANALDAGAARDLPLVSMRARPTEATMQFHRLRRPGERGLIEREGSWRVVEFVARVDDVKLPFDQVREHVQRRLEQKKMETTFDEQMQTLRGAADVRLNEAALADYTEQRAKQPPIPRGRQ